MSNRAPTNAEKAMGANAQSRARQGAKSDRASKESAEGSPTANPPSGADLTGPGGDPAEGKR